MTALVIAGRELRALFLSPLAWVVAGVLQLFFAWVFLLQLESWIEAQARFSVQSPGFGVTQYAGVGTFTSFGFILMFVVPILAMRVFADERRNGTLALLLASPATLVEIVIGKFLGLYALLLAMLALFALMPLSLALGTAVDWGLLAAALLGMALQLGAFCAIGVWASSLTRFGTIAAVTAIGLMLLLYLIDAAGGLRGEASAAAEWLSLSSHAQSFSEGRFSTTDVAYYAIVMLAFLTLTVRRLDADRLPR